MGIYIPNMSKPKSCKECPFTCEALQFFNGKDRPQTCPLIEIDQEAIDIAQDIMDGCKELKERVDKGIVRCGECKWWNEIGCAIRIVDESDKPKETDFCSFGERRTDERPKTNRHKTDRRL